MTTSSLASAPGRGSAICVPRFIEEMPMADGRAYQPGAQVAAAEIRDRDRGRFGRARVSPPNDPTGASAPGPARYFRLDDEGGGRGRAALRHHLADDRALLHHLQPPAALDVGRAPRLPCFTTTPSTCGAPLHRGRPDAVARAIRGALAGKRRRPHTSSSSGSADRARRWYKSADDRRRAHQATNRGPGARVRGAAGGALRDPERQHGSRPARRDGRVREDGRRPAAGGGRPRRHRSTPAVTRW